MSVQTTTAAVGQPGDSAPAPTATEAPATGAAGNETPTGKPQPESPASTATQKPQVPQDRASKTFAAVAKREKSLQRKREEIAQARAQLDAERTRLQTQIREIEAKYAKPDNPLKALERYGWSYKDATEFALNDAQPTAEMIARANKAEIEDFKKQHAAEREQQSQAQLKAQEANAAQTIEDFKGEIGEHVKGKEEYELINLYEASELVYDTVEAHYNKTGRVLAIKEASELVEKYLTEQAERTFGTKKFQGKVTQPPKTAEKPATQARPEPSKTLSNDMSALTPPSSAPSMLASANIEAERMRKALAALG